MPLSVRFLVILVLLAVGTVTCILGHHCKMGARSWSDQRNKPQASIRMQLPSPCPQQLEQQQYSYALATTTASVMYSAAAVQERHRLEAGAFQDHLVQLQSVQTDLILDLPHSVSLPDGEEHHSHHCTAKLQFRDSEQQGEITRNFIRPPPNRTVHELGPLPTFRSNSVGVLQKPSVKPLSEMTTPLVTRSHSVSSSSREADRQHRDYFSSSISNQDVSPHLWIPALVAGHQSPSNPSGLSGAEDSSSRTNRSKPVVDTVKENTQLMLTAAATTTTTQPSSYSDLAIWDSSAANKQDGSV